MSLAPPIPSHLSQNTITNHTTHRWGNLNGVVASNIYRQADAPGYKLGHGVVVAYLTLFLFLGSIATTYYLREENKKRLSGKRDHWVEGKSQEDIRALGDERPDFIYTT
jgi:hypothetical protein